MIDPFLKPAPKKTTVHLNCGPGQDSHERFALQAEAESLRQTVEKIAMQVGCAWLQGSWQNGFQLVASGSHLDNLYMNDLRIESFPFGHYSSGCNKFPVYVCAEVTKPMVGSPISTEHAMLTKSSMDWDADAQIPQRVRCCETG